MYDYRALFVWVNNRTCQKIVILAYCFNIFGSIFGVWLCLLIRKLILGSKTIWQSMSKFPCAVWYVGTFLHMNKEKTSFFLEYWTLVWFEIFWENYLFMGPENLQMSLKISLKFSWEKRYHFLLCSNDINTWLLITLCNIPTGLAT